MKSTQFILNCSTLTLVSIITDVCIKHGGSANSSRQRKLPMGSKLSIPVLLLFLSLAQDQGSEGSTGAKRGQRSCESSRSISPGTKVLSSTFTVLEPIPSTSWHFPGQVLSSHSLPRDLSVPKQGTCRSCPPRTIWGTSTPRMKRKDFGSMTVSGRPPG